MLPEDDEFDFTPLPPPLTKGFLDGARCESPGCDHKHDNALMLIQRCHPGAGLDAKYDGTLEITCHECGQYVYSVKVSD